MNAVEIDGIIYDRGINPIKYGQRLGCDIFKSKMMPDQAKDIMQEYKRVKLCYMLFHLALLSCATLYLLGNDSREWVAGYWFVLFDLAFLVLWRNIKLHRIAQAAGIEANTLGLKATLLSCLFFTPIEAVLLLPALNLYRLRLHGSIQ